MKKLIAMTLSGFVMSSAMAEMKTVPAESNKQTGTETNVDVSKNVFTGSKTVTTTQKSTAETKPGVKNKRFTKNMKKYDKNGNLIKDETETDDSAEQNK